MARSKRKEAVAAIEALISEADTEARALPNDGSALFLGDILQAAGLSWNHLRRYDEVRERLESHAHAHGLLYSRQGRLAPEEATGSSQTLEDPHADLVPAKLLRDAQKRLAEAEKRCAELRAENVGLRTQLSRQSSVAELISRGGRISPS